MLTDPPSRRLRFDITLGDEESIPGAIARGVREHVLVRTAPVLTAAGVAMKHIGHSQLATPKDLERLAFVARCDAGTFLARAGERVGGTAERALEARFGTLLMPRAFLELDRRRIGPTTLRRQPYHRLSWMNLLLPYCPVSLERLVDACPGCDGVLGWRHAVGIDNCEHCGTQVPPAVEAPLSDDLAEDYRLFSRLSSPDARRCEDARGELPIGLRSVAPAALVRLALLLGGLVQDDPVTTTSRHSITDLPPAVLASVAASGAALLRGWPTKLQRWVVDRRLALGEKPDALERLRVRLKRLVDQQRESVELVALVSAAIPDLQKHAAHGFSTGRSYYLYKDVQRLLGLTAEPTKLLKNWKGLRYQRLNTAGKEQGQFDVEQIDGLVPLFRATVPMNACTGRFKLPLYAIEQLCGAGLLEWEDHGAIQAVRPWNGVRAASVEALTIWLVGKGKRIDGKPPSGMVTLAVAAKQIGGRLKPWAAIFDALCKGAVPFGVTTEAPTTTSIHIRAADLTRFTKVVDHGPPDGLRPSQMINQWDAGEVLNINPAVAGELSHQLAMPFARSGQGMAASRERVLTVAGEIAWDAEVSWHLGVNHWKVDQMLSERGIRRAHTGWCRRHLVSEGILPGPPA